MDKYRIEMIEIVLSKKLLEAYNDFGDRELRIIDIGVFPWHQKIELSFLFVEDDAEIDDIADWPHYDYSRMDEGGWADAIGLANDIAVLWNQNHNAKPIFRDFGVAAVSDKVQNIVKQFNLSPDFVIQVLDPDDGDSDNFCV